MTLRQVGLAVVVGAWAAAVAAQAPPPLPSGADLHPPLVRVLLESAGPTVSFPQPGRPYRASCAGRPTSLWGPLTVSAGGSGHELWQVGAYADEAPTIAAMHQFIAANGYALTSKHHEIYLSDARRVVPEKNKTILRQPVKKS